MPSLNGHTKRSFYEKYACIWCDSPFYNFQNFLFSQLALNGTAALDPVVILSAFDKYPLLNFMFANNIAHAHNIIAMVTYSYSSWDFFLFEIETGSRVFFKFLKTWDNGQMCVTSKDSGLYFVYRLNQNVYRASQIVYLFLQITVQWVAICCFVLANIYILKAWLVKIILIQFQCHFPSCFCVIYRPLAWWFKASCVSFIAHPPRCVSTDVPTHTPPSQLHVLAVS